MGLVSCYFFPPGLLRVGALGLCGFLFRSSQYTGIYVGQCGGGLPTFGRLRAAAMDMALAVKFFGALFRSGVLLAV